MPLFPSLSPPARLSPAGRLDRLRHALETVGGHLSEGIADAAAQAVAGAVRDAVLALLRADGQHTLPLQRDRFEAPADLRSSLWSEADEADEPWHDQDEGPWSESPGQRPFSSAPTPAPAARPPVRRWLSALSAGWQAGRWCLRRRRGHWPLLAALGVGLTAGLGALLVGSFLPAGVGLLGSALQLASLADVTRFSTALLGAVAP